MEQTEKKTRRLTGRQKDLIFYSLMLAFPVLQFCVFYIGVNFNSILMSFQEISYVSLDGAGKTTDGATTFVWTLSQYAKAFEWLKGGQFTRMLVVSLKSYAITLAVSPALGLLFAYYIFKKLPAWGVFRVLLFLPSILSGVVMAAIFRYFLDDCLPVMIENIWYKAFGRTVPEGGVTSLLSSTSDTAFGTLMFFNLWIGFGTSVLLYSNKMAGIPVEVLEAGRLDGATGWREFIHIVFPQVFSTLSVFLISGFAQICSNQYNLYNMYGSTMTGNRQLCNLGYYLFVAVNSRFQNGGGLPELPFFSAIGVVLTLVAVPLTLGIRWLLEKFGPSED